MHFWMEIHFNFFLQKCMKCKNKATDVSLTFFPALMSLLKIRSYLPLLGDSRDKELYTALCRWASLLCITPPKRYYHLPFINLPGLQKPGRNHFPKNSYWGITDLGILVLQNNPWTNSLIRVQGDCAYILFSSFSKLF